MSSINPLEKQKQTQIGFAVSGGALGFVICAALPALAYLLLSGAAISLFLYRQQWEAITDLHTPIEIDKTSLTLMGFGVLIAGIFFMPLNPFNQTVLCSLIGAGLAGFFVNQCVQKSQLMLDKHLQDAAKSSNIDEVNRLLKLGADPHAFDDQGNSAFHYSIQNHANAPLILEALQYKSSKNEHDFHSLLDHAKALVTDHNIRQQWSLWWQSLKVCFNQNNAQNRVNLGQAFNHVFEAYLPILKHCLHKLTRYLREKAAYPKEINQANGEGATVLTLVNKAVLATKIKAELLTTLTQMNAKEGEMKVPTVVSEAVKPATLPASAAIVKKPKAAPKKGRQLSRR